jgi:hypothetical protein
MSQKAPEARPFSVVKTLGHVDLCGEKIPDRWAVARADNGKIVELLPSEAEACERAAERNAERMLREAA